MITFLYFFRVIVIASAFVTHILKKLMSIKNWFKANTRYDYKKFRFIRASKDRIPQGFRNPNESSHVILYRVCTFNTLQIINAIRSS